VPDFENPYIKDKSLEELIDALPKTAEPGSAVHELMKAAIQVRLAERLATPRRWALVALVAAVLSAAGAVASAIAAFADTDPEPAPSPAARPTRTATPTATPFFSPSPEPGEGFFDQP
jgi:hypothetical protein